MRVVPTGRATVLTVVATVCWQESGFAGPEAQAMKLHRIFRHFDRDHSGVIGIDEFNAGAGRCSGKLCLCRGAHSE